MRTSIFSVCLLLVAAPLAAQEIPDRLTLDDALRLARLHNPQFLQVLNDLEVAAAQERQGWGALLPTASASLGFTGSISRTLTGSDPYGDVVTRDSIAKSTTSSASQGVSFSMTLFDGGGNIHRLRAERANVRSVDARIARQALELRQIVANAFFAAVQQRRGVEVEEQLLASAREQLQITQRRFEIGSARREELLGAEAQVLSQEQQLFRARGEARKAQLRLLQQMGISGEPSFDLADEVPDVFDPALLDTGALVAEALASSPRIREREAALRASESRRSAARSARLPRLSGTLGFGRSVGAREYDAFFDLNPPNRSLSFSLSASLPLFTGFQTTAAIASANAAVADAQAQLRQEQLAVETEVREALVDLENAYAAVELAERALALSQERLQLTQERYRSGTTVQFVELQQAIDRAAQAERNAIEARFNFVRALIALETKVGKEVRP